MGLLLGVITYIYCIYWQWCKLPIYIINTSKHSNYCSGSRGMSPLYGTEYQQDGGAPLPNVYQHNVPSAVCCTSRSKLFMLPARDECPTTWTLEYSGYLMTESTHHYRNSFECVDKDPESIPGSGASTNGAVSLLLRGVHLQWNTTHVHPIQS